MSTVHRGVGDEREVVENGSDSFRRLADIYHELLSEQTLDVLLDKIANALTELIPYDTLTIYESDEVRESLTPVLARDEWAEEVLSNRIPYGVGITGWVARHREPVRLHQAHLDERVEEIPGTPVEPEALISVPLIARDSVKGVLNIYRQGDVSFTDGEWELAKRFADSAALAIDNARIRAALEHQAQTDPLTGLYNHRFFQERLRSELIRSTRNKDTVGLILLDIDDFKRLNDVHGHASGDGVLVALSEILRSTIRASDVACRVGGEEFAVILPSCDAGDAMGLARRLRDRLSVREFDGAGSVTLSIGIAQGPQHASNPRALVGCAEMAMMTAKAQGKDKAVLYDADGVERPGQPSASRDNVRSIAHLKMLQSLAGKLNRLNEVRHIADTISDELRTLIDYHNCRVYLTEGTQLVPVAFRGEFMADGNTIPEPTVVEFGEGIAGRAASTGRSLLIPNAIECDFAIHLPGTAEIEESIIAVPMLYGSRVNGVVLLSQLGIGEFDEDDVRLLEVLAGQASVAMENARLYESQRREAESARTLLRVADLLLSAPNYHSVGNLAVEETARLLGVEQVSLWLKESDGMFSCVAHHGFAGDPSQIRVVKDRFTPEEVALLHEERSRPYVVFPDEIEEKFPDGRVAAVPVAAIAPLRPGEHAEGWLAVRQPDHGPYRFSEDRLRLIEGLAHQVAVALQKASLYREQKEAADVSTSLLEFSHEVSSIDNLELLLQRIVERSAQILGSPQAMLWLQDEAVGEVVCEAAHGFEQKAIERIAESSFPLDVAGPFLARSEPFVMKPEDHNPIPGRPELKEQLTYAVAPFKIEGRAGCLVVTAPALGSYDFSERKMNLLAGIADQTKLALTNATAYQALEDTFVSTVEALANALEANDEYTSSHARSIAEMTRDMGGAFGLDQAEVKRLEMAALFHDIGKIGIPSEILLKPGPLDPDEWEIMKQHPELGERILQPIERLQDVCPIVRHCHEHYDGTGYPDQKVGDDIPLEARIILVCDAFNAMTTDRPYRSALPTEEALARLRNRAGTQFDPRVVEVFLQMIDENPDFGR